MNVHPAIVITSTYRIVTSAGILPARDGSVLPVGVARFKILFLLYMVRESDSRGQAKTPHLLRVSSTEAGSFAMFYVFDDDSRNSVLI